MAETTVIIPNWNTRRWLDGCLGGLREQRYKAFRTILVDNGSSDGSVAFVREHYPEVEIIAFPRNRGFAAAVNAGIAAAEGPYVALLNVDTRPRPEWLWHLVRAIERDDGVACIASRMLNLEDPRRIDAAGDTLSWYGSARKRGQGDDAAGFAEPMEVFSACAGAALYRRSLFEEIGGFDAWFISYLEDIDVGLRARLRGYRCLYEPRAEVLHHGHGAGIARSRYVYLMMRNRLALLTKNIPLSLLWRHRRTLLYGQLYFFLVYKRPLAALAGIAAWATSLPYLLRQRRAILAARVVDDAALDAMLIDELGEPPLRSILKAKLRSLVPRSGSPTRSEKEER